MAGDTAPEPEIEPERGPKARRAPKAERAPEAEIEPEQAPEPAPDTWPKIQPARKPDPAAAEPDPAAAEPDPAAAEPDPDAKPSRLVGVNILIFLYCVAAFGAVVFALLSLVSGSIVNFVGCVLGVLLAGAVAIGLYRMSKWGWWLAMSISVLGFCIGLVAIPIWVTGPAPITGAESLIFYTVATWYLQRGSTRAAFDPDEYR